jgi:RND family efflux transporter MFP subunit
MNDNATKKITGGIIAVFKRPWLIVLVTVVVITLLFVTRPKLQPVSVEEKTWPVEIVEITLSDQQPELELFGEVVSGRRSELRALVPGSMVSAGPNFKEGARVAKGELLVEIDPFDYRNDLAEQKALYSEAQVRMKTVQRDLKRIRELYDENNVSEQNLDDAVLAVELQTATLEQRRISLARAQRALSDTRLTAPYDGVVNAVSADLGKQLSVNDMVAEVIDTSRLDVRFTLSNAQFGRVIETGRPIEGRPVRVAWQVGNETLEYVARVDRVGAEIDSTTGGIEIYAAIEPDAKTLLRPGAFVWVHIADKVFSKVFRAPESALYDSNTVYVVNDGRMAVRGIEVVGYFGNDILFIPRGEQSVQNGDRVIITQVREGGEGVRVDIRQN